MQKHLEVLASLTSRLNDLSRQLQEVQTALEEELERVSSFVSPGGDGIGMEGAGPSDPISDTMDLEDAKAKVAEVEPPLQSLAFDTVKDASLDDFVAVGSQEARPTAEEESVREALEPLLDFDLVRSISLADTFLFANELFFGNKAQLEDMLAEIEHFSSMSQVEDYLYRVRGFSRDDATIQRLVGFIVANASVRK